VYLYYTLYLQSKILNAREHAGLKSQYIYKHMLTRAHNFELINLFGRHSACVYTFCITNSRTISTLYISFIVAVKNNGRSIIMFVLTQWRTRRITVPDGIGGWLVIPGPRVVRGRGQGLKRLNRGHTGIVKVVQFHYSRFVGMSGFFELFF